MEIYIIAIGLYVPSTNLFIDQTSGYLKNKRKLWGYICEVNTKGKQII